MTRSQLALPLLPPVTWLCWACVSLWVLSACGEHVVDAEHSYVADAGNVAPVAEGWHAVFDDLDSLVLSGWAASDEQAFFVGSEGLVLHYQAQHWSRMQVPSDTTLWWVWGTSASNVYAGGEHGTLLHFDGSRWVEINVGLRPEQTIWGIWGTSETEIWVVGGNLRSNGPGFVLRGDGQRFEPFDFDETVPNLFKVWGFTDNDVYAVGDHGVVIHFDRAEATTRYLDPDPEGGLVQSLFTVAGNAAGDLIAVGGVSAGMVFEKHGDNWRFDDLQTLGLNGVAVAASGDAYVVGLEGTIRHRVDGDWRNEDFAPGRHYHSAVLMGDVAFAVGGDLLSPRAERRGLIAARGAIVGGEISWAPNADAGSADAGDRDGVSVLPAADAAVIDAGHAGSPDAGHRDAASGGEIVAEAGHEPPDANAPLPGPAALCTAELECAEDSECWLIQAENERRCVTPCATAAECPPEYGDTPQCAVPGCQTLYTVCMPAGWKGCF